MSVNVRAENTEKIYDYRLLSAGSVKPKGWIKEQLERDLTEGYIGHFDKVHPTVTHNLFVKQNRHSTRQYSLVKEWWSGEHEGYWKDAVIRMAFLTDNEFYKEKAKSWVSDIVKNTGDGGYIGIYADCDSDICRFKHKRGNGELWVTSRILMAMMAYYEYTGDKDVLDASEKAVQLIMDEYSNRNYFSRSSRGGGVSHGIGFFENLEWLYRLTNKEVYLEFALKLYKDFTKGRVRDDDLKLQHLLDENRHFRKHGAHVAEGIFVPEFIAAISDKEVYDTAARSALDKLFYHITPGGAMRCDEWVKGRKGSADEHYEYCGIAEMISPFNKILAMTGDMDIADRTETMVFNAGQGARFPKLTALSYLTSDNRIKINHREIGKRESYDAAHRAAACCVLNGGRLMPYYVEGMWMKDQDNNGLLAALYGPCEISTTIQNTKVRIIEDTDYPFSDDITFKIDVKAPVNFKFTLRKPHDCKVMKINGIRESHIQEYDDKIVIHKTWNNQDEFNVVFNFENEKVRQGPSKTVPKGGYYLKRGPLVFALPFQHEIDTVKEYNNSGFHRYKIKVKNKEGWKYTIKKDADYTFKQKFNGELKQPWDRAVVHLNGTMYDKKGNMVNVSLVPLGNTIFRRVTFPEHRSKK